MQVTGKPVSTGVGVFFILLAVAAGILALPDAKQAQSPLLYIIIFGGLFVAIPAILGIAVLVENVRRNRRRANPSL